MAMSDKFSDANDIACQRLMRRWGVTKEVAQGMIAIKTLGGRRSKPIRYEDSPTAELDASLRWLHRDTRGW